MNSLAYRAGEDSGSPRVVVIDKVEGDTFAQWLERCYWGKLASGRYTNSATEQADFNQAMAGA